ncbi:non-ribosomal peptide synthetase [Xanthomonas arboricola]|uniref:non-ribosomal peptide synthetase n=1 Tax=Xanthomonas arboricola TaxID=56448 RepID=UPI0006ACF879|nr:non-ribosomal peptide synthetase [Xanthomonas arboricola]MDN0207946.1 non-ribosomal peptide synthetase [Xanthomonas arboricola pv. corylina]MDN0212416.1 non-ribosomal peptide synthetase [Xanthomonas arboricola pv. corylina]
MVFFSETLPHAENTAQGLAARELSRRLSPSLAGTIRVVQFIYTSGSWDLFITACRDTASLQALIRLAHHLSGSALREATLPATAGGSAVHGAGVATGIAVESGADETSCVAPVARWYAGRNGNDTGLGYQGPVTLSAPAEVVAMALTRVILAFTRQAAASVRVLADVDTSSDARRCGWTRRTISADGRHCKALLSRTVSWPSTQPSIDSTDWLGIVVQDAQALDIMDTEALDYLPFLQPPYPALVEIATCTRQTRVGLRYDRVMLGDADAHCFLECVATVARQLMSAPGTPLDALALLDDAQHRHVVALAAGNAMPVVPSVRIEAGIAYWAVRQPGAVAISDDAGTMTYAELQDSVALVASQLARRGVRQGDHVGLCVDRSRHMIVAAIAVMALGGTYVPIDPKYPADRIIQTCADADLCLLVVQDEGVMDAVACPVATLAALLEPGTGIAVLPRDDLTPDAAAYMIYTSGSTGRPKGVRVTHRSVHALISAVRDDFALAPHDVWSFFHSFSFDFSVWEIWGALLTGACVHVIGHEASRDPAVFIQQINARGITVLSQTPSAFNQLMTREAELPIGPHLRLVIFGGEALNARRLLPWFDRHPEHQCRLVNMFGITETTVHVTARTVRRLDALEGSRSVGRPIPGWQAYVLSPDLALLPPGVDGEIHVAGAGVALGYHARPELTAERFVANPFGPGLLYRSGDRGRLLPNGELIHLGRLDNQIKLRGFRIELDEIRSVLMGCTGVADAAVVFVQRDAADEASARIDAYVVLAGTTLEKVWDLAQASLPDHMLPAAIAAIPSVPLTINGKADAVAMAARVVASAGRGTRGRGEQASEHTATRILEGVSGGDGTGIAGGAPVNAMTGVLVDIWQELFSTPVTSHDNFFDLGGNSLVAIRMASKARERGLPALNLRDLYMHQTIAGLSTYLAASRPVRGNAVPAHAS